MTAKENCKNVILCQLVVGTLKNSLYCFEILIQDSSQTVKKKEWEAFYNKFRKKIIRQFCVGLQYT